MPAVALRRAGVADAERLAALGLQAFRETFLEGFAIPYPPGDLAAYLRETYTPAAFAGKLHDPLQATWIAEDRAGEALAYANAGHCTLPHAQARPTDMQLNRLYVLDAAQGKGLGRRLLEEALRWMQARSQGPLWIGVWSGNLKAQRLYAAYGFEKVGEYDFPVGTWLDHEYILRRT